MVFGGRNGRKYSLLAQLYCHLQQRVKADNVQHVLFTVILKTIIVYIVYTYIFPLMNNDIRRARPSGKTGRTGISFLERRESAMTGTHLIPIATGKST